MKIILLLLLSICPIISYADNDPYRRMTRAEAESMYGQSSQSPAPKQLSQAEAIALGLEEISTSKPLSQAEAIALGLEEPRTLGMTNQEMIILFGGLLLLTIYLFPTLYWYNIIKNNSIKNKSYILTSIILINLLTGWLGITWLGLIIGAVYVDLKVLKE